MARTRRRQHQNPESMISQLPTDLIYNILSRLPVKPLFRFKSVSKEYYSLIKHPSFIRQHQEYSHLNPNPTIGAIFSTVMVQETRKAFFQVHLYDALDKPIDIGFPFLSDCLEFYILGICNGLVCVLVRNKSCDINIMICNLLTGEFRKIPPPDTDKNEFNSYFQSVTTYFGFCLNADKGYELFKMAFSCECGEELGLNGKVFSLTTNAWREIDVKSGFDGFRESRETYDSAMSVPVFRHGIFYWETSEHDVLSFDIEKEVFDVLLTPSNCRENDWGLQLFNEEIVVVIYEDNHTGFSIWVLNEQKKDWTYKFCVRDVGCEIIVLGCTKSGQIVIQNYNKGSFFLGKCNKGTWELLLYDIDTEEEELLPCVIPKSSRDTYLYTESLVSVNVGRW